jgi:subtilase family serine protease
MDTITFNGNQTGDGSGQIIAIVDAYDDPRIANDLTQFDKAFGLIDPPSFFKYNQDGQMSNLPGTDPAGAGTNNWEGEEALDVEWAHAIAPRAGIALIECNSPLSSDLYAGVSTAAHLAGVSVVSMSWGGSESSGELSTDTVFTTPLGHQGVTFVASSGDSGSPPIYPACSPNVVAVGGTTLFVQSGASGNYIGETGWSKGSDFWSPAAASGGGVSLYEPEPAYQVGTQNTGKRTIPDVSLDADPVTGVATYDSYNETAGSGPWTEYGGTSLSAPCWAGLVAIANQGRALLGETTLNSAYDPTQTVRTLYGLSSSDFHDITTGNNGGYSAGPGYDLVTGRGSPIADRLVGGLALAQPQDVLAQFTNVVSVAGYYTPNDGFQHAIVATGDGKVHEVFFDPTKGVFQGINE